MSQVVFFSPFVHSPFESFLMFTILNKTRLNGQIVLLEVEAGEITRHAKAGQFIVLRIDERGERIPLTIYDMDREKKTLSIVIQEIGKSTKKLGMLNAGDAIRDLIGPLGHPTAIQNFGKVLCVGGGVGTAPLFPITRSLVEHGNDVDIVLGFKNKDLIILEDRMRALSRCITTTDDGSNGRKGLVTDVMRELLLKEKYDKAFIIGPLIMMKFASRVTLEFNVPTIVSLNSVMVDGTGMCGGCRVGVGTDTKFACVDGPEFDAATVHFDEMLLRQNRYGLQEKESLELHHKECPWQDR